VPADAFARRCASEIEVPVRTRGRVRARVVIKSGNRTLRFGRAGPAWPARQIRRPCRALSHSAVFGLHVRQVRWVIIG